jgi:hypothetical protein
VRNGNCKERKNEGTENARKEKLKERKMQGKENARNEKMQGMEKSRMEKQGMEKARNGRRGAWKHPVKTRLVTDIPGNRHIR